MARGLVKWNQRVDSQTFEYLKDEQQGKFTCLRYDKRLQVSECGELVNNEFSRIHQHTSPRWKCNDDKISCLKCLMKLKQADYGTPFGQYYACRANNTPSFYFQDYS